MELIGNIEKNKKINGKMSQIVIPMGSSSTANIYIQDEEPIDAPDGSIWIDTNENPPEIEVPQIFEQENEPTEARNGDLWIDTDSFLEEVDPTVPNWAKQPNKPKYTAAEVGATTPQYVHKAIKEAFQNSGAGSITKETDPTVPDWAKQPQKPSYTADEVGAATIEDINQAIANLPISKSGKRL